MPKSKVKSKKEQPKTTSTSHIVWIIGIVAVVAIIAIVFVNTRPQQASLEVSANTDDTAFAGQAIKAGQQLNLQKTKCPTCPAELKYYEITAAFEPTPQAGNDFQMSLSINNEQDTLSLPTGYRYVSPSGFQVTLQDGLYQAYAGGIRRFQFTLEKACAKGYLIKATDLAPSNFDPITLQNQWQFWMDGEQFNLAIGESHTLADGTKIIFRNIVQQNFAGGMYVINFDILCKSRFN